MTNADTSCNGLMIVEVVNEDVKGDIEDHLASLAYPMDSWLEDRLMESVSYKLMHEDMCIGYAGLIAETLHFFHVRKEHFKYAPIMFEKVIQEKGIKRVFVMTQDALLSALIAEWDYDKEKQACWFTDSRRPENWKTHIEGAVFRVAQKNDVQRIRSISGDFFDEASGGFRCLEERIEAGTIFVLTDSTHLLGVGIVEQSQWCPAVVSIGMYVDKVHRKQGCARTILLNLKRWAYSSKLIPVAGCWYYNTLSRKSLESAGMIVTSIGYEAILKGKEDLPLRTGNPPGELV